MSGPDTRTAGALPDVVAAADRLGAWDRNEARAYSSLFPGENVGRDIDALVAGFRAAVAEGKAMELRAVAAERRLAELRQALAAYRSALRSGESESEKLRALGDAALAGSVVEPAQDEARPAENAGTRAHFEPIRGDIYLWRIGELSAEQALTAIDEWMTSVETEATPNV